MKGEKGKNYIIGWERSIRGEDVSIQCSCRLCIRARDEKHGEPNGLPTEAQMMILCEICGNKRCPHANNHALGCTNSNESGQKGSAYE